MERESPGLEAAHVEQVLDQLREAVERLVRGEQQLLARLVAPADAVVAQRGHRRLGRRERAAQVVAHRVQQSGSRAVGLGDRPQPARPGRRAPAFADRGGLGGERGEQALVGRAHRTGDAQAQLRRRGGSSVGGESSAEPTSATVSRRRPRPRTLEESDRPRARRSLGRARGARAARSRRAGSRRPARPGSPPPPRRVRPPSYAGRRVRRGGDECGDRDEHQQRQRVVLVRDRERVERRREVVVEQQAAHDRGARAPATARRSRRPG